MPEPYTKIFRIDKITESNESARGKREPSPVPPPEFFEDHPWPFDPASPPQKRESAIFPDETSGLVRIPWFSYHREKHYGAGPVSENDNTITRRGGDELMTDMNHALHHRPFCSGLVARPLGPADAVFNVCGRSAERPAKREQEDPSGELSQ